MISLLCSWEENGVRETQMFYWGKKRTVLRSMTKDFCTTLLEKTPLCRRNKRRGSAACWMTESWWDFSDFFFKFSFQDLSLFFKILCLLSLEFVSCVMVGWSKELDKGLLLLSSNVKEMMSPLFEGPCYIFIEVYVRN